MKTFDEIYDELQNGDNNELNKLWKEAKEETDKAKKIILRICIIIDSLLGTMVLKNGLISLPFILNFALVINLLVFIVVNICYSKNKIPYSMKYKKVVINKLMNNFYDNLEYFPQKPMPQYLYKDLKYGHYDKYSSDDYMEAQINNKYGIQMAEVLTQRVERRRNSRGGSSTTTVTTFSGLFAKIEMEKSINSELRIMQNGGMLMQQNRLQMDSGEFEKYFDVKASNKIIGMQLLTADVMEQLIEFENKTNMKYDITINNNNLYLRFHCGAMFEPGNIKKGILDKAVIQKYFYMLNFTYNLSNKLINVVNDTQI